MKKLFLILPIVMLLAGCKGDRYYEYTMTCLENGEYIVRIFTEDKDKEVNAWANEGSASVTVKERGGTNHGSTLETFRWAYEHQCRLHSRYLETEE